MGKKHFIVVVHSIEHKIPKTTYEVDAFSADRAIETVGKKLKQSSRLLSEIQTILLIRSLMRVNLQEEYLKLVNHF